MEAVALFGPDYCGGYARSLLHPRFLPWPMSLSDTGLAEGGYFGTILAESFPPPMHHDRLDVTTFGLIIDWARNLDALKAVAPFYDALLVDASGVVHLPGVLDHPQVIEFVPVGNFSQARCDRPLPWADREIDVLFVGSLTPEHLYAHRCNWVEALRAALRGADLNVVIEEKVSAVEYRRLMSEARIVFNPTTDAWQKGVNARNFEAAEYGCLVMYERSNDGARAFVGRHGLEHGPDLRGAIEGALADPVGSAAKATAFRDRCRVPRGDVLSRLLASVPIDRLGDRRTAEQRDASQRVRPSWM